MTRKITFRHENPDYAKSVENIMKSIRNDIHKFVTTHGPFREEDFGDDPPALRAYNDEYAEILQSLRLDKNGNVIVETDENGGGDSLAAYDVYDLIRIHEAVLDALQPGRKKSDQKITATFRKDSCGNISYKTLTFPSMDECEKEIPDIVKEMSEKGEELKYAGGLCPGTDLWRSDDEDSSLEIYYQKTL